MFTVTHKESGEEYYVVFIKEQEYPAFQEKPDIDANEYEDMDEYDIEQYEETQSKKDMIVPTITWFLVADKNNEFVWVNANEVLYKSQ